MPGRRKPTHGDRRREQILAAARDIAAERGLWGITVTAVAERTSGSRSNALWHFETIEGLQIALVGAATEYYEFYVVPRVQRAREGIPRFHHLIHAWETWSTSAWGQGLIAATIAPRGALGADVRRCVDRYAADWCDFLVDTTNRLRIEGALREDVDPRQFGFELQALLTGEFVAARTGRDEAARLEPALRRLLRDARRRD